MIRLGFVCLYSLSICKWDERTLDIRRGRGLGSRRVLGKAITRARLTDTYHVRTGVRGIVGSHSNVLSAPDGHIKLQAITNIARGSAIRGTPNLDRILEEPHYQETGTTDHDDLLAWCSPGLRSPSSDVGISARQTRAADVFADSRLMQFSLLRQMTLRTERIRSGYQSDILASPDRASIRAHSGCAGSH